MISRRSFLATLAAIPFVGWSIVKPNKSYVDVVRLDNLPRFIRVDTTFMGLNETMAPIGGTVRITYSIDGKRYFDTYKLKPGQTSFTLPKFEMEVLTDNVFAKGRKP